ncbi:alpha/beta fold hydrolase [Pseudonocardia yuanmonensis]|uniref:Alpha/beta fold hydrolase n=1 Tax=Pseudonocardia yuanmonensis TaxID=1095914 RepID=A0ABP8XKM3_9PSEU
MPIALAHGNPETSLVWGPLVRELVAHDTAEPVLLSPPGFGAPVPPGFGSTAEEYRAWLVGELERFGEPVDLVGHDWGAGHLYAVAATRPDLLRSWIADCAGIIHPDYVWHPAARTWQTPGEGETLVEQMVAMSGEDFVASDDVPADLAPQIAAHFDDEMGRSILAVYRSAAQPYMRRLGERLAAAPRVPSLIVHATADRYTMPNLAPAVAERLGSELLELPGAGHWWMWDFPAEAAAAFTRFWARLG